MKSELGSAYPDVVLDPCDRKALDVFETNLFDCDELLELFHEKILDRYSLTPPDLLVVDDLSGRLVGDYARTVLKSAGHNVPTLYLHLPTVKSKAQDFSLAKKQFAERIGRLNLPDNHPERKILIVSESAQTYAALDRITSVMPEDASLDYAILAADQPPVRYKDAIVAGVGEEARRIVFETFEIIVSDMLVVDRLRQQRTAKAIAKFILPKRIRDQINKKKYKQDTAHYTRMRINLDPAVSTAQRAYPSATVAPDSFRIMRELARQHTLQNSNSTNKEVVYS